MNIKETIQNDLLEARKNGDQQTASLLRTVLGEFERLPTKEVSNEDAIKVLQKVEKNLNEVLAHGNEIAKAEAEFELEVVSNYLPKKLTIQEMTSLYTLFTDDQIKHIGDWMKHVKQYASNNNLTFDGKDAKAVYEAFED